MSLTRTALPALLAALTVTLSGTAPALAAEENIAFKRRGDEEKRFVTAVGTAVIKAAHGTGRKIGLVKYEFTSPKANRTELSIKMEYYGLISGKRYVADIVVKIDSTDKKAWEVLNVEYTDNNNIPSNTKKIQDLIKEFNK
jgi:hypothetical protein